LNEQHKLHNTGLGISNFQLLNGRSYKLRPAGAAMQQIIARIKNNIFFMFIFLII